MTETKGRLYQGVSRTEFGFKMLQNMGWSEGKARAVAAFASCSLKLTARRAWARRARASQGTSQCTGGRTRLVRHKVCQHQLLLTFFSGVGADAACDQSAKVDVSASTLTFDAILASLQPVGCQSPGEEVRR